MTDETGVKFAVCHRCVGMTGGCTGACKASLGMTSHIMGPIPSDPKGCICPPTSEQTCQRWDCGRKSPGLHASPPPTPKEKA